MSTVQLGFNTQVFRVILSARKDGEFTIGVVRIPARQTAKSYATAHGKRIKIESLMKVDAIGAGNEVLFCIYAQEEMDVEAAITLAWEAARRKTAQSLADAKARFQAAHSKPSITRKEWSAE